MTKERLIEGIEDLDALKCAAKQYEYPLRVYAEFGLEPFGTTVHGPAELDDAFTVAVAKSTTRTVGIRRL